MRFCIRTLISWLPLAVVTTLICMLVYATVQQNYRQSLNDPQIQMAEDGASKLAAGDVPASLVSRGVPLVDIEKSLQPWIAVYDASGLPLESSAVLNGKPPQPPQGVFDSAKDPELNKGGGPAGENRVTWQPQTNVRQAIVVVWTPEQRGMFVVAGRNMREVEDREGQLSFMVFVAWVVTLGATFVTKAFVRYIS